MALPDLGHEFAGFFDFIFHLVIDELIGILGDMRHALGPAREEELSGDCLARWLRLACLGWCCLGNFALLAVSVVESLLQFAPGRILGASTDLLGR